MKFWLKVVCGIVVFCAATLVALYLAGVIFLVLSKMNYKDATLSTFYQYWYYYHNDIAFQKRINLSGIFGVILAYGIPIALYIAAIQKKRELYGAARFANSGEIRDSGLLGSDGIIVGKYNNRYMMLGGQQSVALAAPQRSGKGVGVGIPNCLNFKDSLVVADIKLENYKKTAGFRAKYQEVYLFNPFTADFHTHRYNPLHYVRRDENFRVTDLLGIGEILYPTTGNISNDEKFFNGQAQNLFLGLALYLFETPELPCTIGELFRQSSGKGRPVKEYITSVIDSRAKSQCPLSNECVDALNRFICSSDNTLSGIVNTFNSPLLIWANPIVDAATSANEFDLRDLRKKRMTIYVGITPDNLKKSPRLLNLFFSQLVDLNIMTLPEQDPSLKFQCLMLLDEFAAFGRMESIIQALPYMAGYNLRLLLIFQTVQQIIGIYGLEIAKSIMTGCALQILYAPKEQSDAEEFSQALGTETVKSKSLSRQLSGSGSRSESESDQRRPLLLPQEIKEIGKWKEIIIYENTKPIFCDKIRYHKEKIFKERLLAPPGIPLLDLDTHKAIIEGRIRPMTEEDLDSRRLAINPSLLPDLSDDASEEEIAEFVNKFFSLIDSANLGFEEEDDEPPEEELNSIGPDFQLVEL